MKKIPKTNVMRILDGAKLSYQSHSYDAKDGKIDGISMSEKLSVDPSIVYKTLVTVGASGEHYVFVIGVAHELDLKKAAAAVGEKSVHMVQVAELLGLTGYIRGGCSPVGMKKQFATVIDESACGKDILVSAGKIGVQVQVQAEELAGLIGAKFTSIIHSVE
jgi:Cys-tRNA(Pro)/Cys-tRNA(Cys) deacylase